MPKHRIVAYRSTFLKSNVYEKIHQFLSSIKKDVCKRKSVPFFCLMVYDACHGQVSFHDFLKGSTQIPF